MLDSGYILDNRYKIVKILGKGGQGCVYLAQDSKLGTACAVKEFNNNIHLLAEPEILKQLKHPSLPRITDIIVMGSQVYIVEEYFQGTSLKDLISNREYCNERNVLGWYKELCEILEYLHAVKPHPIIYRDMKPDNIIIDSEGHARLVDFGIAREYKAGQESDTMYLGTRGYAAPEQYGTNQSDERTDIYSLGVTMYHAAAGIGPNEPPYEIRPVREINPHLSEGLETIISRCVKTDPGQRYQSAAQLRSDLENIHTMNREYRTGRLKKRLATVAVVVLILASVYGVNLYLQQVEATRLAEYSQYLGDGAAAYEKGDYTQAEFCFNQAALLYPEKTETYLNFARNYLAQGQNQKVVEYLIENINAGKLDSDENVKYLLGTAYFNLQDYEKSLWYFKEAIKTGEQSLGEDYYNAYRDLAVSYGKVGDYDLAQEILDLVKSDARFDRHIAHYINGELYLLQNSCAQALGEFKTALQLDQANLRYKLSLAQLYLTINNQGPGYEEKLNNYQAAISLLQEVEQADNYNIIALNDLGRACYECGMLYETRGDSARDTMYQQALLAFNKMLDLGAADINVLLNTGILDEKLGKAAEAEQAYKTALEMDANSSRANLVYGLYKLKQKDYTGAYQYLNKTVQMNKNAGEVATAQAKIDELKAKGWI